MVNSLADLYPGSNHVYTLQLDTASDREIWEYAQAVGFSIVTKDADFSDLCMLLGFPPKIIWIRRGNCRTAEIEAMLRRHHAGIEALDGDNIMGVFTLF